MNLQIQLACFWTEIAQCWWYSSSHSGSELSWALGCPWCGSGFSCPFVDVIVKRCELACNLQSFKLYLLLLIFKNRLRPSVLVYGKYQRFQSKLRMSQSAMQELLCISQCQIYTWRSEKKSLLVGLFVSTLSRYFIHEINFQFMARL